MKSTIHYLRFPNTVCHFSSPVYVVDAFLASHAFCKLPCSPQSRRCADILGDQLLKRHVENSHQLFLHSFFIIDL